MEDEGSVGVVLARATELRLKIGNCVHRASSARRLDGDPIENGESGDNDEEEEEEEDDEEEAGRLVSICDALESLETQLSSLQGLQQQQRYEREVALGEIEQSRKALLDKLKEYKGEALEVINEASAFAGETVEQNSDLLLPPYPSPPAPSFRRDNGHFPHLPSMHKPVMNGEKNTSPDNSEQNNKQRGFGFFLGGAAKMALTIVGVVSVLALSGYGPKFVNRETAMKLLGLHKKSESGESRSEGKCPPGRVLVVENGEVRCLVKERVEVPFSSVAAKPDVNYGCG